MSIERLIGPRCEAPFPVYPALPKLLLRAHSRASERDAIVAHVLGTGAGYCYSDLQTVAAISSRLGMDECQCVRVAQAVDAMYVFSTACLVQSRCGRVAILSYRGTADSIGTFARRAGRKNVSRACSRRWLPG